VRYLVLITTSPRVWSRLAADSWLTLLYKGLQAFLALVAFKMVLSIALVHFSNALHSREAVGTSLPSGNGGQGGDEAEKENLMRRKSMINLMNIERYTVIKGRIRA